MRSGREINRAMLVGGVFILVMTGTAFTVGPLSNVYFMENQGTLAVDAAGGNVDGVIPLYINLATPPWFAVLFMLCLLSAAMSTMSSQFHTIGTAIGRDVYEQGVRGGRVSEGHSILIARLGIVTAFLITVGLALWAAARHRRRGDGRLLRHLCRGVPPGLAAEEIDSSGAYTCPGSDAYQRFHELYVGIVRRRGGHPDIGRRLPLLLVGGGLEDVQLSVVQPMALRGDAKLLNPLTMQNIADTVVRDGLATRDEVDSIVDELHRFADDPGTIAGLPRIVQAWGMRPRRRPRQEVATS